MPLCPACDAEIELDEFDVDKGETISCPECGVDLEVVGLAPLELDVVVPADDDDDWGES
jgi:alpha-aminoadipate carrier protein LysW